MTEVSIQDDAAQVTMTASDYEADFVMVTPEIAQRWLLHPHKNRPLDKRLVGLYALDMLMGRWLFDGATIGFSKSGQLLQGQHRLHAVVQSGVPVLMLIVRGLSDESQDVMDTGRKRTVADMFSLHGKENASLLASTCRHVAGFQAGNVKTSDSQGLGIFSSSELRLIEEADPTIRWAVHLAKRLAHDIPAKPTAVAFAAWLMARVDIEDAREFLESVAEMRTDGSGDPRFSLLRRLGAAQRGRERLSAVNQAFYFVKAWNAWRVGAELKSLKSTSGGVPLPFPELV